MPQHITHPTDVFAFQHHVEGIKQKLTFLLEGTAHHTTNGAGFVAAAHHVFSAFVHNHVAIGFDGGGALRSIGRFADVGIWNGNRAARSRGFADIGKTMLMPPLPLWAKPRILWTVQGIASSVFEMIRVLSTRSPRDRRSRRKHTPNKAIGGSFY